MRTIAFALLRPVLWLALGLSVAHRDRLPHKGPALVAANHNSHLDILALMSAFPLSTVPKVTALAAADYFAAEPVMRFIAFRLLGVMALERRARRGADPLAAARAALEEGRIVIVFPEGTRGQPEEMGPLKAGLSKLARDAGAPVTPVYLQGLGRILPKGTRIPVPFTATMIVGEPIAPDADRSALMARFADAIATLRQAAPPLHWH